MAFTAITSGEITSGQPVATTTQTKIKDNFDDHEERLQAAELTGQSYPPIIMRVNGRYGSVNSILKTTINHSLTVTGVRILVDQAGSAGTLQIDILRKRGVGAFETIFTGRPSVAYTSGNDAISASGTLDAAMVDLEAGDILRLDITSAQTAANGFLVRIDYNRG